jgi:hypothetical protein
MTTTTPSASERITVEATSWPGVESGTGDRGEFGFRVGRREIGHLHGDRVLHIGFPKAVWQELFDAGRIGYHPVFPGKPGYGSRALESDEDVEDAIALLRLNYERVTERHGARLSSDQAGSAASSSGRSSSA